jgi:molecular chaperone HtpG
VRAIWARNKNEIKDEEYNEFYTTWVTIRKILHACISAPMPVSIQALLFVPARNFETLE